MLGDAEVEHPHPVDLLEADVLWLRSPWMMP
jgi:hypothetical protein